MACLLVGHAWPATKPPHSKKGVAKKGVAHRTIPRRADEPIDPAAVNDSATSSAVGPGAKGAAVVRLQILLDRAHFSPGQIDGNYGDNLRVALLGYQTAHQLNPSGVGDDATWKALNADTAPALITYVIAPQDEIGPFVQVPADMMAQAKLNFLGFQSPSEELGERFHLDPRLLSRLNPDKDLSKAGEQLQVPNVQRTMNLKADRIAVSKSKRTVSALAQDGTIIAQYPATMGSEHDPLPIGDWKVVVIQQNPVFNYNPQLFWDANPKDAKARIPAGPNNPVGVVWIGLSKDHYGIHGTPEPGKIGHTESHGCIRLTNWDAEELSHLIKNGAPVALQE
jgi:lipoprotein-anchoring transpeptidase ErfK/SrfK